MTRLTRRGWIVVVLVGVLAFFGGVGLFKLLVRDDGPDRVTADGTESPAPTIEPTATPDPTPAPAPTLTPTPAATLTPTPSATTAPKPTASKTSSPTPKPTTKSPTPKPTTKSPTPLPSPSGTTHTVHMTNVAFSPSNLTIKVGDSIRAVTDEGSHTFTSKTGPAGYKPWDSDGAATYTVKFTVPGDYTFICKPHENVGMTGTIKVQ